VVVVVVDVVVVGAVVAGVVVAGVVGTVVPVSPEPSLADCELADVTAVSESCAAAFANWDDAVVPSAFTLVIATTEIRPTRRMYSTNACPRSPVFRRFPTRTPFVYA
jgi:hypothetical protein